MSQTQIIGIITFVIIIIISLILKDIHKEESSSSNDISETKYKQKQEWMQNLKMFCRNNNISYPTERILLGSSFMAYYEKFNLRTKVYVYQDNLSIIILPIFTLNKVSYEDISKGIVIIPYNNVLFYSKDGQVTFTNEVVDKSKDFSLSGAVVGGVLFGNVGAAIGSQKDNNKVEIATEKQDNIHTYLYYKINDTIKVIDVESEEFFWYIKRLLPEKDYAVVQHTQQTQNQLATSNDDIEIKLSKLKDLYESGLITAEDYSQKKQDLLDGI